MLISEGIKLLQMQMELHGDLPLCIVREDIEHNSVSQHVTECNTYVSENARPNGPDTQTVKCLVFHIYE